MKDVFALQGVRIFDGMRFHDHHGVLVCDGKIVDLVPQDQIGQDITRQDLAGGVLSPGFIDAQVNGGGGVMLNDAPTPQAMAKIAKSHCHSGTTSLLPTLISDEETTTIAALEAAVSREGRQIEGVCGLHLEGPHLAPARKGAHLAHFMRPLTQCDIDALARMSANIGTLLVTIAPEQVTSKQVSQLVRHNIIVSLGHSNATYIQAMRLFDAGATGVTHLFNAMSQIGSREPGLVGAALDHGNVWAGIIADGYHVNAANLRLAWRAKQHSTGQGRLFFVSDAMALMGTKIQEFTLHGRRIFRTLELDGSRLTLEDGTLAGSDINMAKSVRFGISQLDLSPQEALAMATSYPARFLKLSDRGFIRPCLRADFVHLDENWHVQGTWVSGVLQTVCSQ